MERIFDILQQASKPTRSAFLDWYVINHLGRETTFWRLGKYNQDRILKDLSENKFLYYLIKEFAESFSLYISLSESVYKKEVEYFFIINRKSWTLHSASFKTKKQTKREAIKEILKRFESYI